MVAILVVLGALLFCRRNRKRSRTTPAGSSYGHVLGAHDRELQAEKEMNVVSSAPAAYEPIDRHPGFENHSPVGQTQEEPRGWYENGEDAQEYHDEPQTPAYGGAAGVSHLREPGMSPEELARLDEEERRLDEAIAEAERR